MSSAAQKAEKMLQEQETGKTGTPFALSNFCDAESNRHNLQNISTT